MQQPRMKCPFCGTKIKFPERLTGRERPCPKCRAPLVLQEAGDRSPAKTPPVQDSRVHMRCPSCGVKFKFPSHLVGREKPCPKCKKTIRFQDQADDLGRPPVRSKEPGPPVRPPSPPRVLEMQARPGPGAGAYRGPAPAEVKLPERMKANLALVGRVCPGCGKEIQLGNEVYNCPGCFSTMHHVCYGLQGKCANPACPSHHGPVRAVPVAPVAVADQKTDRIPCRFCHEPIDPEARKCKHCGEFQSETDRLGEVKHLAAGIDDDEKLSPGEIVFGILCGTIACITGLVWGIQGKKKGWKLLGLSVISQVCWGILRALVELSK